MPGKSSLCQTRNSINVIMNLIRNKLEIRIDRLREYIFMHQGLASQIVKQNIQHGFGVPRFLCCFGAPLEKIQLVYHDLSGHNLKSGQLEQEYLLSSQNQTPDSLLMSLQTFLHHKQAKNVTIERMNESKLARVMILHTNPYTSRSDVAVIIKNCNFIQGNMTRLTHLLKIFTYKSQETIDTIKNAMQQRLQKQTINTYNK